MSSLAQYDGWTVEDIVARNSHELTAVHVLGARTFIRQTLAQHRTDFAQVLANLDEAQQIGRRVMQAKRAGRKTIRIDEVTR